MTEKKLKCAFTGHRENKLDPNWSEDSQKCEFLKQKLAEAVQNVYYSGIHHFICGMAHGCDLYFAEAVLSLKREHPDVVLEAAIPFDGQADNWGVRQRVKYDSVLSRCDVRTMIQKNYTRDCMMRRNKYMVDNSSVLVAVYNGCSGGTRNTMFYAMRQGLEIVEIEFN